MTEKADMESTILDAIFRAEMTTLKGIEALRGIGITEGEARSLTYEAARAGRDRRAAAPGGKLPEVKADWQTRQRGTNSDEYQIYVENARSLGWDIKTFDEWINS